jgi:hypothetical protein
MLFRTELNLNKSPISFNHKNNILLIGSCFSDNIGKKLAERKFNALVNPFGTIYNSFSIKNIIQATVDKKEFKSSELDVYQNIFSHPDFHSQFNNIKPESVIDNINEKISFFSEQLPSIDVTFITIGTSWVYYNKEKIKIVSNCHKQPQSIFTKKLTTLEENIIALKEIIELLRSQNVQNKIIFTLSPVRHIKDGILENHISKSILAQAIYHVCQNYDGLYFPAFEIMMDDLRDYRFYKEDLIHPSDQAIEYIWEKFVHHYFEEDTKIIVSKIEKINAFLKHRPLIEDGTYSTHKVKNMELMNDLKTSHGIVF